MTKKLLTSFILLTLILGCQSNKKTGIDGNNNNNNQVIISEQGDITINDKPKTIKETGIIPENILSQLNPGTSINFTKELLGEPKIQEDLEDESQNKTETIYVWHFNNAFISIRSIDNQSIETITLIKSSMEQSDKFTIYPLNYELGNLQYSDIKDLCESSQKNYSSKFYSLFTKCYFGNPGKYYSFEFGLFEGGNVIYNQAIDDINVGPFNYVSISSNESNFSNIFFWGYYR